MVTIIYTCSTIHSLQAASIASKVLLARLAHLSELQNGLDNGKNMMRAQVPCLPNQPPCILSQSTFLILLTNNCNIPPRGALGSPYLWCPLVSYLKVHFWFYRPTIVINQSNLPTAPIAEPSPGRRYKLSVHHLVGSSSRVQLTHTCNVCHVTSFSVQHLHQLYSSEYMQVHLSSLSECIHLSNSLSEYMSIYMCPLSMSTWVYTFVLSQWVYECIHLSSLSGVFTCPPFLSEYMNMYICPCLSVIIYIYPCLISIYTCPLLSLHSRVLCETVYTWLMSAVCWHPADGRGRACGATPGQDRASQQPPGPANRPANRRGLDHCHQCFVWDGGNHLGKSSSFKSGEWPTHSWTSCFHS